MSTIEKSSALGKALLVIEAIVDQPQAVGLPDLAERLGLPRQTVHRILQQLEEQGLIVRDPARNRFAIGQRLSTLAMGALNSGNQNAPQRAILAELVAKVRETCNIGVLDGPEFLYLDRIECEWPLRIHLQSGSRVPAYCTSGGRVLLAHMPDDARARLLRATSLHAHTKQTIIDRGRLETLLSEIRLKGYALNDEEFNDGIVGIAVPILANDGRALAALALHAPRARMSPESALAKVVDLKSAAMRIADLLAA